MRLAAPLLVFLVAACDRASAGAGASPSVAPAAPSEVATAESGLPVAASPAPAVPAPEGAVACGELDCLAFDSPEHAFARVLEGAPRVLAVGETHAQKGVEGVPSSTRRFMETLLPGLKGRATDLVIELWVASGKCGKTEKKVAKQTRAVTVNQAQTNQSEFVELGTAAKRLGIRPHALEPTCEEYERIAGAGAADVAAMLEMIAKRTAADLKRLSASPADAPPHLVVAYGGALHNDLAPRPGREAWSFGPEIDRATDGGYVELDLIVREYVLDTEVWRSQPWYAHFDAAKLPERTLLMRLRPRSYVLIFPASERDGG